MLLNPFLINGALTYLGNHRRQILLEHGISAWPTRVISNEAQFDAFITSPPSEEEVKNITKFIEGEISTDELFATFDKMEAKRGKRQQVSLF